MLKKKALIVYKAKKTSAKVLKAKAYITTFKEPLKTLIKSLKKVIVIKKVEEVIIY